MSNIQPISVEITTRVSNYDGQTEIVVTPVWGGVDRPRVGGWALGAKDIRLAQRLADAIMAGVVYEDGVVRIDVDGNSYVSARSRVMGRKANADLKRLGF